MTEVKISKSALTANLRAYRRAIGDSRILAVVKANAYGHDAILTTQAVELLTDWFGVASGQEALTLRNNKIRKPILVMSFYATDEISELVKRKISLAVYDLKQAGFISAAAKKLKRTANIHLKIDTGTSRVGIFPNDAAKFVHELLKLPNIKIEGLFSHFAASEMNLELTNKQNHLFNNVAEELEWRGISPIKHIACTAAGIVASGSRHDMVRLGIGLFGLWPSDLAQKRAKFSLKPALSWRTKIIQVKDLPKGAYVGYGLTYQTKRPIKLAVLPVGYYDGYDRKLGNVGEILIGGRRCKILGRVCMNLMMVDVTAVKHVKAGDNAILIGRQGKQEITADELAKKIGTINYEVVARINPLIRRVYVK